MNKLLKSENENKNFDIYFCNKSTPNSFSKSA